MTSQGNPIQPPVCPYCGSGSKLVDSRRIFGRSMNLGNLWVCARWPDCDSYVGVHTKTNEPLGNLAGPKLRLLRTLAHQAFDPLWQDGLLTRKQAYKLLGGLLGLAEEAAHISKLTEEDCQRVVNLFKPTKKEVSHGR